MNVAELLNTNAERFPERPAIGFKRKDGWQDISWPRFRKLVFKAANALRNAGVAEGDRVAIYSDNSAEWITFDLAVLALGAITVPIYSTNNENQARYIIEDSEAKVILAGNQAQYDNAMKIAQDTDILTRIVVAKKSVWIQKESSVYFEDFIEKESEEFEIVAKDDDDLATIIYTSGTTGTPKGVMLSHGNFIHAFQAHHDFFRFQNFEYEHSLAFLPLTHVFERSWTLLCLSGGAKVTFLEDTRMISNALTEVKPTMMCAVPRFYQKIYAGVLDAAAKGSKLKQKVFNWAIEVGTQTAEIKRVGGKLPSRLSLKNAIAEQLVFSKIKQKMGGRLWFMPCGGASVSPEITRFFDAVGIHLTVGYGLTESTATIAAFPFLNYKHGTAGKPLGSTEIKLGENHEILAKGPGIMRGYYKKPKNTAAVFTPDGFFKTGDAGTIDAEGNLVVTDRIKDLMKTSNGKYIAPQPVENLFSNSGIIEQIVLVAEGKPFVSALIVPNFELLKHTLDRMNIKFTSWSEIVSRKEIQDYFKQKIEEIQKDLDPVEKVKKFTLLPSEFEIGPGEITPTLKVKRGVILQKYAGPIEKMYE